MTAEFAYIIAGSLFANVVGAVIGFGAATLLTPFMLLMFGFRTTLLVVAISHVMSCLARVFLSGGKVDRKLAASFAVPGMIASVVGAIVTLALPERALFGAMGVFLILFSIASLLKKMPTMTSDPKTRAVGGLLYGLIDGLLGTAGAIRSAFIFSYGLPAASYVATSAAIAVAVDAVRVPVYLIGGGLEPGWWKLIPALAVTAVVGAWLGAKASKRVPEHGLRTIILLALLGFGLKFLYDAVL